MTWRKPGSGACSTASTFACGTSSASALRAAASAGDSAARAADAKSRGSATTSAAAIWRWIIMASSVLRGAGLRQAIEFGGEAIGRHRDLARDHRAVGGEHRRRAADAERLREIGEFGDRVRARRLAGVLPRHRLGERARAILRAPYGFGLLVRARMDRQREEQVIDGDALRVVLRDLLVEPAAERAVDVGEH